MVKKVLAKSKQEVAVEILKIVDSLGGKASEEQIIDEFWKRGYVVYDTEEKEASEK